MVYTPTVPTSQQSIPAQDRPLISANFTELNNQFGFDHTQFDAGSLNGYHKRVSFTGNNATPVFTGFQSGLNTQAGIADNSSAQLLWSNSQATFPMSIIRAWAVYSANSAGSPSLTQSYNVASVSINGANWVSTVTLSANAVSSNSFGIMCIPSFPTIAPTTDSAVAMPSNRGFAGSAGSFTIQTINVIQNIARPVQFVTFIVLQI